MEGFLSIRRASVLSPESSLLPMPLPPPASFGGAKGAITLREDILNEKVLSCILEFDIPLEMVVTVLEKLKEVAKESDTVFAVDLISVVEKDGSIPTVDAARRANVQVAINGKTCVGLGRPLAEV